MIKIGSHVSIKEHHNISKNHVGTVDYFYGTWEGMNRYRVNFKDFFIPADEEELIVIPEEIIVNKESLTEVFSEPIS